MSTRLLCRGGSARSLAWLLPTRADDRDTPYFRKAGGMDLPTPAPKYNLLGGVCLSLACMGVLAAIPLGCVPTAVRVGGAALLDGGLFGTSLALVTRTRRPIAIYAFLMLAAASLWPLYSDWPSGGFWNIHPWRGAPRIVYFYLDALRTLLFLLGIPFPFARFGRHAPDPLPSAPPTSETTETETEIMRPNR